MATSTQPEFRLSELFQQDPGSTFQRLWERIQAIAPDAFLMRAPIPSAEPFETAGGRDLDILLSDQSIPPVRDFLLQEGFRLEYARPSYLARYRLRLPQFPGPVGVDLYRARAWGDGYLASPSVHMTPIAGLLLRAVVDGKGPGYFAQRSQDATPAIQLGERVLSGSRLLTLRGLLLRGVVKPDLRWLARTGLRRLGHLLHRLRHHSGLEICLLGVDGTGKTSVAAGLAAMSPIVRTIYLGDNFCSWPVRFVRRFSLPRPLPQMARHFELFTRRLKGLILARRGYIVVYDRHPMERLAIAPRTFRERFNNLMARAYARPVDFIYWFQGDPQRLWERKKEHPPEKLRDLNDLLDRMLRSRAMLFESIDVVANGLPEVLRLVSRDMVARYSRHLDIARVPGLSGKLMRTAAIMPPRAV